MRFTFLGTKQSELTNYFKNHIKDIHMEERENVQLIVGEFHLNLENGIKHHNKTMVSLKLYVFPM